MKIPDTFNRMGINADVGPTPPPPPEPIPTSGLVFYTPASGAFPEYAETEQGLLYDGTLTPANKDNIACFHVSEGSICSWDVVALPHGNEPFTMSVWACMDTDVGDAANEVLSFGVTEYYQAAYIGAGHMYDGHGEAKFGDHLPDIWCANTIEKDEWYHLLQTYDGEYFNCYINGVLVSSEYCTDMNISYGIICVGGGGEGVFGEWWHGYFTAPRVYNRVLTSGEINALAHEFTPMTVPTFNDQTITFTNDVGATTTPLRYNAGSKTVSFDILSGTLPNTVTFNPSGSFTYDGTTIATSATYQLAVQLSGAGVVTTSANVTIEMRDHEEIPTRGLTMWQPLSSSLTHPEIGDDFELTDDSITLTTNQGIHCAQYVGNYGGLRNTTSNYYNTSNTEVTVSVWAKYTGDTSDYWMDVCPMSIGNWANSDAQIEISMMNYGNLGTRIKVQNGSDYNLTGYFSGWHHYAATLSGNGSNPKLYIDGEYIGEQDVYGNQIDVIQAVGIGGSLGSDNYIPRDRSWVGYIAGCRIYNRALEPNEILKLAGEYIPLTDALFGSQEFNFSNSEGASSRSMWFDVENKTPVFTVVSGSLPNGVTMNSTLGTFAYDGTTIAQDEDIQVVVELSGVNVNPASGVVTFKMTDQAIVDTNDYFYIQNENDSNDAYARIVQNNSSSPIYIEWSIDKSSWHQYPLYAENKPGIPFNNTVSNGKIYFRGVNSATYGWKFDCTVAGYLLYIGGKLISLLDKTCQSTSISSFDDRTFYGLFENNGWLYSAANLEIPDGAREECYNKMFADNNQLNYPPQILPAVEGAESMYHYMFINCGNLQSVPQICLSAIPTEACSYMFYGCGCYGSVSLSAATIGYYGCQHMFYECRRLTDVTIMASQISYGGLMNMFENCESLNSINIPNMTSWGNDNQTVDWVAGVAASGVFNCPPALPKEFGTSRIPVGWKKNPDLLYFQAMEDNSAVALKGYGTPPQITLSTSFDGTNWTQYTLDDTLELQHTGDKVFFKGNNSEFSTSTSNYYHFKLSGNVNAYGNIMSLLKEDGDLYELPSGSSYTFNYLFGFLSALHSAPELPATTLNSHCYYQMFQSCSNLTTPPKLPAMTMTDFCYADMFRQSGLSAYPDLPATILDQNCYKLMFQSVPASGSVTLPALSAADSCYSYMFSGANLNSVNIRLTDLKTSCCSNMFKNCGDLNSISVKFTDWNPTAQPQIINPFDNWVQGVAQSGTFNCPSGLPEEYGDSRIPSGWSVSHAIDPIVTSGLTFFQPFARSYITPQVGHDMTLSGTAPTLSSVNGVDCVVFDGNQLLYDTNADYWTFAPEGVPAPNMTVSMWVNVFNFTDGDILDTGGAYGYDYGNGVSIGQNEDGGVNYVWCDYQGHYRISYPNAVTNQWYHIAWKTYDDAYMSVYVNGQYIGSDARWYTQLNHHFIGLACHQDNETLVPRPQNCAIAGFRIYDRTLEDSEIALLAAEF